MSQKRIQGFCHTKRPVPRTFIVFPQKLQSSPRSRDQPVIINKESAKYYLRRSPADTAPYWHRHSAKGGLRPHLALLLIIIIIVEVDVPASSSSIIHHHPIFIYTYPINSNPGEREEDRPDAASSRVVVVVVEFRPPRSAAFLPTAPRPAGPSSPSGAPKEAAVVAAAVAASQGSLLLLLPRPLRPRRRPRPWGSTGLSVARGKR